jgi:tripartite-type tricarboxylate transporter receptor subunit TctC
MEVMKTLLPPLSCLRSVSKFSVAGLLLSATLGLADANAQGQAFPSQPIKLIVPFTPGTGYDTIARAIGPVLADKLGTSVVVENRPGASGTLGAASVARAPADGHTLTMLGEGVVAAKHLSPGQSFDPVEDLAPVALVGYGTLLLVASNASQITSVAGLIERARKQPGKLTYGSPGPGTSQHLKMELIKSITDTDMLHVPYKGSAGVMTDLLGGHLNVALVPIHQALESLTAKQMQAIAIISDTRNQRLPAIVTFSEAGISNVEAKMWYAVAAPKDTPRPIVAKLTSLIDEILKTAEVNALLYRIGIDVSYRPPPGLLELIRRESDESLAVIKKQGLAVQ